MGSLIAKLGRSSAAPHKGWRTKFRDGAKKKGGPEDRTALLDRVVGEL
jgi:hypothetical protein